MFLRLFLISLTTIFIGQLANAAIVYYDAWAKENFDNPRWFKKTIQCSFKIDKTSFESANDVYIKMGLAAFREDIDEDQAWSYANEDWFFLPAHASIEKPVLTGKGSQFLDTTVPIIGEIPDQKDRELPLVAGQPFEFTVPSGLKIGGDVGNRFGSDPSKFALKVDQSLVTDKKMTILASGGIASSEKKIDLTMTLDYQKSFDETANRKHSGLVYVGDLYSGTFTFDGQAGAGKHSGTVQCRVGETFVGYISDEDFTTFVNIHEKPALSPLD